MQARAPRRRGHSTRNNTIEKERDFWGAAEEGRGERGKKYSFVKNVKDFCFVFE